MIPVDLVFGVQSKWVSYQWYLRFDLRGVLNCPVSRVQAYNLVHISMHTCEYAHDTTI